MVFLPDELFFCAAPIYQFQKGFKECATVMSYTFNLGGKLNCFPDFANLKDLITFAGQTETFSSLSSTLQ